MPIKDVTWQMTPHTSIIIRILIFAEQYGTEIYLSGLCSLKCEITFVTERYTRVELHCNVHKRHQV